jgi:hypothetical protein
MNLCVTLIQVAATALQQLHEAATDAGTFEVLFFGHVACSPRLCDNYVLHIHTIIKSPMPENPMPSSPTAV